MYSLTIGLFLFRFFRKRNKNDEFDIYIFSKQSEYAFL